MESRIDPFWWNLVPSASNPEPDFCIQYPVSAYYWKNLNLSREKLRFKGPRLIIKFIL